MKSKYWVISFLMLFSYFIQAQNNTKVYPDTLELPFIEFWESNDFEANGWDTVCGSWEVENHNAVFNGDHNLYQFSCTLTSSIVDLTNTDNGNIWLNYKLYERYHNLSESITTSMELYDGENWITLKQYINDENLNHSYEEIDITQYSLGNFIQIRLKVEGDSSIFVNKIHFSQIELFRVCGNAPSNLDGVLAIPQDQVYTHLTWDAPETDSVEFTLTGFNIFHQGWLDYFYSHLAVVPYVEGQIEHEYYHPVEDPWKDNCYKVTAIWTNDSDTCESFPAQSIIPIWDFVCVLASDVSGLDQNHVITIYPNPASDVVRISGEADRFTIYILSGQMLRQGKVEESIDVSDLKSGVYIIELDGVRSKLVVL